MPPIKTPSTPPLRQKGYTSRAIDQHALAAEPDPRTYAGKHVIDRSEAIDVGLDTHDGLPVLPVITGMQALKDGLAFDLANGDTRPSAPAAEGREHEGTTVPLTTNRSPLPLRMAPVWPPK